MTKLEKLRNSAASVNMKTIVAKRGLHPFEDYYATKQIYKDGWNAAVSILMPEIDKFINSIEDAEYNLYWKDVRTALKTWKAFLAEEASDEQ